jgi:hypothetical protein
LSINISGLESVKNGDIPVKKNTLMNKHIGVPYQVIIQGFLVNKKEGHQQKEHKKDFFFHNPDIILLQSQPGFKSIDKRADLLYDMGYFSNKKRGG